MIVELHVVDLGIVADLDLLLPPGLTAITGETGAGKTLVVEAIELLVGGRADPGLVRDGADEARVEGRLVDPHTGDETVLARVVPRVGRSRAYVDGRLATATELAEVGARFVDLHGQHAHQSLLDPAVQRAALDQFAGRAAQDALASYRDARVRIRRVDDELAELGGDGRARAREIDLLRFQVDEIARAELADPVEEITLEAEELLLADAAAHREALGRAYAALEGPVLDALGSALAEVDGRAPFAEIAARLRAAQAELADVEHDVRLAAESVTDDPERLEVVRGRRQLLRDLGRKYGASIEEVVAYGAEAHARLARLESYEARAAELEAERAECDTAAERAASELSEARRDAAPRLARAIEANLHELALEHARVEVRIEDGEPTDDGADRVVFLLAPNPGESPKPLARAASGGELSRAMLAARVVLTGAPPTLVFDEVDAGIGGEAGIAVGRLLATLGARHQVLCVTHLAQVAAFADTQVVVEKAVVGNGSTSERTVASATPVDGEDRVAELSRMLAGVGESSHARRHAAELLSGARRQRAGYPGSQSSDPSSGARRQRAGYPGSQSSDPS
jgi:DNA repair protein RecN (Recombination protein N)